MIKKLFIALASALTLSTVIAPAAQAAYSPSTGPLFNSPTGSYDAKYRLMRHVERAIASTHAGGEIHISTYLLDRDISVDKLLAAWRYRNVSVQVVMDNGIESYQATRLMNALNKDGGAESINPVTGERGGRDRSFAMMCRASCRMDAGHMHSKFYLFSEVGTANDVVMVSSANLNKGGATLGWNDLFTITGRTDMYNKYVAVHKEMVTDTSQDGDSYISYSSGDFLSRFFPMKNATRETDPVMQDLAKVSCTGANDGAGIDGRTAIHISMFRWGGDRGMYIAKRLLHLQREGCRVSMIYGAPSKVIAALLKDAARAGRIELYDSRRDRNGDGKADLRVHSKYLLINGRFAGDPSSWQVFTGSQNWGFGSLTRGDEVQLGIASRGAYAKYRANWNDIRVQSRHIGG
jgi:phosphatidylserine/phosphatidylglycerophosphate/cardiolipin synthase-like enzyme